LLQRLAFLIIVGLFKTTVQLSGISSETTQFAPILQFLPILTDPMIFAPDPIRQLSPIFGEPNLFESTSAFDPIVTC
jgi:hypothetical protein